MVNLSGALVIIFGFLSPFVVYLPVGSSMLSTVLIYIGFLLLLKPNKKLTKAIWLKWGQVGALVNIIGFVLLLLITVFVLNTSLEISNLGYKILAGTYWTLMPITAIDELSTAQ